MAPLWLWGTGKDAPRQSSIDAACLRISICWQRFPAWIPRRGIQLEHRDGHGCVVINLAPLLVVAVMFKLFCPIPPVKGK